MMEELARIADQLPARTPHSAAFRVAIQALDTVVQGHSKMISEMKGTGMPKRQKGKIMIIRAWLDLQDVYPGILALQRPCKRILRNMRRVKRARDKLKQRHITDPSSQPEWALLHPVTRFKSPQSGVGAGSSGARLSKRFPELRGSRRDRLLDPSLSGRGDRPEADRLGRRRRRMT
eukprot:1871688-Rhodomonas_salina.3